MKLKTLIILMGFLQVVSAGVTFSTHRTVEILLTANGNLHKQNLELIKENLNNSATVNAGCIQRHYDFSLNELKIPIGATHANIKNSAFITGFSAEKIEEIKEWFKMSVEQSCAEKE